MVDQEPKRYRHGKPMRQLPSGDHGRPLVDPAGVESVRRHMRPEAVARRITIANMQLDALAQSVVGMGTANQSKYPAEQTIGIDGMAHLVLIPTQFASLSREMPDTVMHIVVDPNASNAETISARVELAPRDLIEMQQAENFPLSERTAATDPRIRVIGSGMSDPSTVTGLVKKTLDPTWAQF